VFNLYTMSICIRHIPMAVPVGETAGWYMKELLQYPPQFKIGFMSNNPPVNDVMPEVKMGAKEWLKEHGFGRLTL